MIVRVIWNAPKMRYDLYAKTIGKFNFVFDTPPCGNVRRFFPQLKKDDNLYEYKMNSELLRVIKDGKDLLEKS